MEATQVFVNRGMDNEDVVCMCIHTHTHTHTYIMKYYSARKKE